MAEHENHSADSFSERFNLDSILRDVARQWWVILMATVAAALLAGAAVRFTYTPQYSTTVTFVVSQSGIGSNTVSSSLTAASTLSSTFSTVVESDILENRVCRILGLDSLDGDISVSVVNSTNLMTMTVKTSSPGLAYDIIQAIMDTAQDLCDELADSIVIQVLQEPSIPTGASNPLNVRTPMKRAGAVAFVAMVLLFATLSYFRNSVKTERDFRRRVNARLLASIPHERKYKSLRTRLRHKHYSLFIENPTLSFSYVEACRMMGTRVRRELDRMDGHVLMVTSVSENEGKSTLAANLAMSLVQEGRKVVLVDCDFRKPAQYKILELPRATEAKCDLGNALRQRGTVHIMSMGMEKNLPVVFSTQVHKHLLTREVVQALTMTIKALQESADYVILDTSPMGLVAESARIASLADASLLVVAQGGVEAQFLNDAIDQLNDSGAKVLGCVFNNVHTGLFTQVSTYGSYYGYGHYGYGHYEKSEKSAHTERRGS